MLSKKRVLTTLRAIAALIATIAATTTYLRRYDMGSPYHIAVVATAAAAIIAGLWCGSAYAARLVEWRTRRFIAFRPITPNAGDAIVILATAIAFVLSLCVWCVVVRDSLVDLAKSLVVLVSVYAASATIGVWWTMIFESVRAGMLFGVITWTPFVTAFLWMPRLVAPTKTVLEIALNVNPAAGVISALGAQKILWSPGIYERLPYAEYGAGFRSVWLHIFGWLAFGAIFSGASYLIRRLRTQ